MKEIRTSEKLWKQCKELAANKNRFQKFMIWVFAIVAAGLLWLARKSHLTYNAINVLVYYWLVPATWTFMIDWKLDCQITTPFAESFFPILTVLLCAAWIGIILATAKHFSKWCDEVFDASVDFLNYFNRWGGNYELNSVIICVAIPIIIYLLLSLMFIL